MKGWQSMSNERKNELEIFEQQHLQIFKELSEITKQKKQLEDAEKKAKASLEKGMELYEIQSIDNQYIKITRVNGSSSTSIDLKSLKDEEPKLYEELLEDYPKVTNRKAYIRFSVK